MKHVVLQFVASFVQIFLLSLQTNNIIDKNIIAIGLTSVGISVAWMINVNGAISGWYSRVAMVVGGSLGAMLSIPFHALIS